MRWKKWWLAGWIAVLWIAAMACTRGAPSVAPWEGPSTSQVPGVEPAIVGSSSALLPTPMSDLPILTPTPDTAHTLPEVRTEEDQYVVQFGDTLAVVARKHQTSVEALIAANQLSNPDYLEVGQVLVIPAPLPGQGDTGFKVIPDSELVYGPASAGFDVTAFVERYDSFLLAYSEDVDGRLTRGPQIIERVAQDYSVNPRLLLAVLEYQSGWVTQANPSPEKRETPILVAESWRKGLYLRLSWAANSLNRGYYLWRAQGIGGWTLPDGEMVPANATINAGTAGVQYLFSLIYTRSDWERAVSADGLQAVYQGFFGYPFHWAVEPLVPAGISQPEMQLPFDPGQEWVFTGGPHGGWADGSAWAALDFAPPTLGCVSSDAWVVAVADGRIVRADQGAVIQDLDLSGPNTNDGMEQTGWVVLYMHVEKRDRVQAGAYVRAGERIGHPSCEGGYSTGTHLHLARRYNGEWISADGDLPFRLDGWVSMGAGREYDGYLEQDGRYIVALEGIQSENMITR